MSFISPKGNYLYTIMPFRLKNARATYQCMITHMFRDKIDKIVEVYMEVHIDDMVVKSMKPKEHVQNLSEVFEILRHQSYTSILMTLMLKIGNLKSMYKICSKYLKSLGTTSYTSMPVNVRSEWGLINSTDT